ncbi:MAG: ATP synthase subunit I, partial [Clostridia bacterium]|nr:ATP synthase subunit I [Clostridia bacterium]
MRIDPAVKKETLYILGFSIVLSVVMELVFYLCGHMDYTVPLGNLLGVIIAVLNFFLMGLTIQNSIGLSEKDASEKLKLSQKLRMLMVIALAAV